LRIVWIYTAVALRMFLMVAFVCFSVGVSMVGWLFVPLGEIIIPQFCVKQ
jgi:hypothetical protein